MQRPLTPEEYERREQQYARMTKAVEAFPHPSVLVVLTPEAEDAAHIQVNVPGTASPADNKLAAQKAIWVLMLFIAELDAAADPNCRSEQS